MSKPDADKSGQDGGETCGGLTLEQYAEVVAHLLHFGSRSPVEVLGRFQLDEATFREAEVGFRIALAEESMQFRTRSLKTFAKRTKEVRRKLEDEEPDLAAVGSPMGNAEDSAAAPAAEPGPAKPARAVAAPMAATPDGEERAPAMPSYAIAAAKAAAAPPVAAPAPAPVEPPAPVAPPAPVPVPAPVPAPAASVPDELDDLPPDSVATYRLMADEASTSPSMDEASTARGLPRDPALRSDDGEGTHTTNVLKKPRLGTAVFEAPPGLADGNTATSASPLGGVLPFKAAGAAAAPMPALEPAADEAVDMSGGTVIAESPFAQKALPWEKGPSGGKGNAPPQTPPSSPGGPAPADGQAATVEGMTVEQYASLCAEIAVKPTQSAEIEKRYRLSSAARHKLDAAFRERFARDGALQSRFKQLAQQYRAWLEKSAGS